MIRPTYVSWSPHCSRSDNTARELGGKSHMVYWPSFGSNLLTVWLKYIAQAVSTFRILSADKPEVVFVMTPPLPAVASVWLWCRLHRVPFVVDGHTGAFLHPNWIHFQWLQNAFCRRAVTTIVTNDHLAQLLRQARVHVTIVRDVPVEYAVTDAFRPQGAFSVGVVCSFNEDEPVAEILEAAASLPGVRFYLTGDSHRMSASLAAAVPPNVTLTGFLTTDQYGSLLTNVNAVMALTTRDHTMLRGAYEAVYQGTPVIVSDWPLLKESFSRGAIHVNNSAAAIAGAVERLRTEHGWYKAEVLVLREEKRATWERAKQGLLSSVHRVLDTRLRTAHS